MERVHELSYQSNLPFIFPSDYRAAAEALELSDQAIRSHPWCLSPQQERLIGRWETPADSSSTVMALGHWNTVAVWAVCACMAKACHDP